jgi:glycerophosphoryl diester phosphodiesterase
MFKTLLIYTFLMAKLLSINSQAQNPVVAHRGAWKSQNLPENSIAALKYANKLGCFGSEFDVHLTSDQVLVVNHDPTYNGLAIENSTYEDLAKFRLANGEKIPTLEDYLKAGKKLKMRMICELKPASSIERGRKIAQLTIELVKKLKMNNKVDYISFDYNLLLNLRKLNTKAHLQYLNGEKSPQELNADQINGLDYHYSVYKKNPEWIEQAKKLGMSLNVWTVNDSNNIQWFLDKKFNQITTNEPELTFSIWNK